MLRWWNMDKGISDDLKHLLAVFSIGWAPKDPSRVPKGSQWTTLCAMRSRDKIFYYGMITLWENWVLLVWRRDKKISEDWRHCLSIFRLWWAPKQPPGPPMVPNEQPSVPWVVEIRCFTMGWFHFGKTKFYSLDWWTDEFRYVFAVFWLWGASSRAQGLPIIPDGLPSVPWEVESKYFTMGWLYYGKTASCIHGRWTKE